MVGLLSAGLRADSSSKHQVGMAKRYADLIAGREIDALVNALEKRKIPVRRTRLQDDIFQTSDENRSIVELASNALDAGKDDVRVTLRDGFYEVVDTGSGMTPEIIA